MPNGYSTKKEMQAQIMKHGETPPSGWTKVQLKARLVELMESQVQVMTERDASKIVNGRKTKAALQEKMDEYNLEYTSKMNSDQLRSHLIRYLMETQVPSTEHNFVGFGKYSQWEYGEAAIHAPSYSAWTVETATNETECHWRLRRYANWYQGLSRSDKTRLAQMTPHPETNRERSEAHGHRSQRSAPSAGSTTSVTETDMELIPEVSQTERINELEAELKQLKEMMMTRHAKSNEDQDKPVKKVAK